jgi:hypothetical protein
MNNAGCALTESAHLGAAADFFCFNFYHDFNFVFGQPAFFQN